MMNVRDIFDLWASRGDLASDLCITGQAVANMIARNSIPSHYFVKIVQSADRRQIPGITYEALARIASKDAA